MNFLLMIFILLAICGVSVVYGASYTYTIDQGRFYGSGIDTRGCAGKKGKCRNNNSRTCQCSKDEGPIPVGKYTIGKREVFKGMDYSYRLTPAKSNDMCGRDGFFIHGGGCSGDSSHGCIVIDDKSREKIESGSILTVVASNEKGL